MPLSTHLRSASGTPTSNMALRSFGIRVKNLITGIISFWRSILEGIYFAFHLQRFKFIGRKSLWPWEHCSLSSAWDFESLLPIIFTEGSILFITPRWVKHFLIVSIHVTFSTTSLLLDVGANEPDTPHLYPKDLLQNIKLSA